MATLRTQANKALRLLFVTEGGQAASAEDYNVAEEALKALLARLPSYGGGRSLTDRTIKLSSDALEDERILGGISGLSVTLPKDPRPGARVEVVPVGSFTVGVKSADRFIDGATDDATVSAATSWVYQAGKASWEKVSALTSESEVPYPPELDTAISAICAVEIADEFAAEITPSLMSMYRRGIAQIGAMFSRPREESWAGSVPRSVTGPGRLRRYR